MNATAIVKLAILKEIIAEWINFPLAIDCDDLDEIDELDIDKGEWFKRVGNALAELEKTVVLSEQ